VLPVEKTAARFSTKVYVGELNAAKMYAGTAFVRKHVKNA
jgi:hypothetical protein